MRRGTASATAAEKLQGKAKPVKDGARAGQHTPHTRRIIISAAPLCSSFSKWLQGADKLLVRRLTKPPYAQRRALIYPLFHPSRLENKTLNNVRKIYFSARTTFPDIGLGPGLLCIAESKT